MAEAAAQAAITAALEPTGAIMTAITAEITKAFNQGEVGDLAITVGAAAAANAHSVPAVVTALKDPASELSKAVQAECERRADAAFPYRARLRQLSVAEWEAAWRDLVVDADHLASTLKAAEQNPALANIWALSAANPGNAELAEPKRASTVRYAAKLRWKSLCFPEQGGSWDRLKNYLTEKADAPIDNVKALARSLLVLLNLTERRCTVVQSAKRTGPEKAASQKTALLPLMYHTIKQYKKRTTKASASVSLEHEILLRDFAQDLILGEAALVTSLATKRSFDISELSSGQGLFEEEDQPAAKAQRSSGAGPGGSSPAGGGTAKDAAKDRKQLVSHLLNELSALIPNNPPKKLQAWIDRQCQVDDAHRSAMMTIFSNHVCKNCLMAGKGIVKRTLRKCRELQNPCFLPCTKCTGAGRTTNVVHWMADCKC
ncbi:unnamed protein product [Prorocentrum cordatum]|uniref:Uncharacterized protein n=1 Tax=Prorocentrum cordatum TaxID=2364126 RepID=A0ABN9YDY4_9DINO|nr:unnamed protein product [Polarella glacialis]